MFTLAVAHAPEVEPHGDETLLGQGEGHRHDDVVVHVAAVERPGMADEHPRDRTGRIIGFSHHPFEIESVGLERDGFLAHETLLANGI